MSSMSGGLLVYENCNCCKVIDIIYHNNRTSFFVVTIQHIHNALKQIVIPTYMYVFVS